MCMHNETAHAQYLIMVKEGDAGADEKLKIKK